MPYAMISGDIACQLVATFQGCAIFIMLNIKQPWFALNISWHFNFLTDILLQSRGF